MGRKRFPTPGPGTYDVTGAMKALDHTPQFSFGAKYPPEQLPGKGVPGPATYGTVTSMGPQMQRPTSPAFSIGGKGKMTDALDGKDKSPGPSAYMVDSASRKISTAKPVPAFSFGADQRPPLHNTQSTPSPDKYAPASMLGPQLQSTKRSSPLSSFGKGERSPVSKYDQKPSPDQYQLQSSLGKQARSDIQNPVTVSFGKGGKSPSRARPTSAPGPAAYSPVASMGEQKQSNRPSSPSFSMKPRGKITLGYSDKNSPGPGQYGDVSNHGRDQKALSFGKSKRPDLYNRSDSPGPGVFVPPSALGPQVASTKRSTPSVSFGATVARQISAPNSNPSPDAYGDVSSTLSRKGIGFGKGDQRKPLSNVGRDSPGPGSYTSPSAFGPQLQGRSAPSVSFRGSRAGDKPRATSPGPSAYMLPSSTIKTDKGFSIGRKYHVKYDREGPGPGQYVYSDEKTSNRGKSPKFTIKGRVEEKPKERSPGPGAYSVKSDRPQSAGVSFGKSNRSGLYKPASEIGPKYTKPSTLGPQVESIKSSSPQFSFGKATRPDLDDLL